MPVDCPSAPPAAQCGQPAGSTLGLEAPHDERSEMPDPDRDARTTAAWRPSDALVLAALERAARHRARDTHAVPAWAILEHLAVRQRSAAARHVRCRLDALHAAGALERSRRHGVPAWELTSEGRRRLQRARRGGEDLRLPESPQHQAWRNARTAATQEMERFCVGLGALLEEAGALLGAHEPPPSDALFELAEELRRACWRVASASYCLYEWPEPDDAHADVDEHLDPHDEQLAPQERAHRRTRRAGRRNIRLWDERP
jgi:hypothetical protein